MKSKKNKQFKSLLTLFFIMCVTQTYGQTPELPGWHSQSPLQMSKVKCFETAKKALNSVGLTSHSSLDNWSIHGTNYNVRAGIYCVPCGNGVHVSVLVATTYGYPEANSIRNRLRDYMLGGVDTNPSSPGQGSFYDLQGQWTYAGTRGNITVEQLANNVTMKFSIKPRTTPSPHYIVDATIRGNRLEGNWKFNVAYDPDFSGENCQGGKFYAEISHDKKKITVLNNTEDPCNHDWAGTVFYRK